MTITDYTDYIVNGGVKSGHSGYALPAVSCVRGDFRGVSAGLSGAALGETIAVAVHLKDADVVGNSIQQRAGQALRSECFGPFVKR